MTVYKTVKLYYKFSDDKYGLFDINLEINKNEFVVIAGRNGAGKSLLVKNLCMLETPESGNIFYEGIDIIKNPSFIRGKVGLIFQDSDSQILGETVFDDIAVGPSNLKLKKDEIIKRTYNAMDWANLTDKAENSPYTLSGGEKRRLSIAGMLSMDCETLIFDEPYANLDYQSIIHLNESLTALKNKKTVILLTHELEKVLALSDRLIILDKGKIVSDTASDDSILKGINYTNYGLRNPFCNYNTKSDLLWL